MQVVAIVQARMTSSRLPGKVLKPILDKPILAWLLDRLEDAETLNKTILAIPDEPSDDVLEAFAAGRGLPCYRGPRDDVLARFEGAVEQCAPNADVIVRITSDCPLLDPVIVDHCVRWFRNNFPAFDYVAPVIPPRLPNGMAVEVFKRSALNRAAREAGEDYSREHVTPFIQDEDQGFTVGRVPFNVDAGHIRLCVDTQADFDMISALLEAMVPKNKDFNLPDILDFLDTHPDIAAINKSVKQTTGAYAQIQA